MATLSSERRSSVFHPHHSSLHHRLGRIIWLIVAFLALILVSRRTNATSMLQADELSGAPADEVILYAEDSPDPVIVDGEVYPGQMSEAMISALAIIDELRDLEVFLESSAAAQGDLSVVTSDQDQR